MFESNHLLFFIDNSHIWSICWLASWNKGVLSILAWVHFDRLLLIWWLYCVLQNTNNNDRNHLSQKWPGKNQKEQDRTINLNCTWKRGKKMLHIIQFQPISSNHALCVSRPNNIFFWLLRRQFYMCVYMRVHNQELKSKKLLYHSHDMSKYSNITKD